MKTARTRNLSAAALFCALAFNASARVADPLPSWNDGPSKKGIIEFIAKVLQTSASWVR